MGTPSPAVTPTNLLYNVVAARRADAVIRRLVGVLVMVIGARYLWSGLS